MPVEPNPVHGIRCTTDADAPGFEGGPMPHFPAQTDSSAPFPAADNQAPATGGLYPRGHDELVLVVDDDPTVRLVASAVLSRAGYRVLSAENGAEGIAMYALRRHEVAVVVTDMMMPIIDGPAMVTTLLQINPGVRVIVASGSDTGNVRSRFTALGVTLFLDKPYSAQALVQLVGAVLAGTVPGIAEKSQTSPA